MLEEIGGLAPCQLYDSRFSESREANFFFPTTRYYGSKKRLLDWISSAVKELEFNTVLDVFGGTATVSLLFKSLGKKVTYNDILKSSRLQAMALLSNRCGETAPELIEKFCESVSPVFGLVSENFKDTFYTTQENEWLDGAILALHNNLDELEFASIFYCLQQACIQKRPFNLFHRKNHYLRENNGRDTKFGNWATWERSFTELMMRASIELKKTRWASPYEPEILPCTDAVNLKAGYDLVYLDPPYIPANRQDISYLERYHFLEGMAEPNTWLEKIDWCKPSRTFYKTDVIRSWNTKSSFKNNLFDLVTVHKNSIVVLSYVDDAHPPLEEIEEFFFRNFRVVETYRKPISHALSSKVKTEVLIIGRP